MNDRNFGTIFIDYDIIKNQPDKLVNIFAHMKCLPLEVKTNWIGPKVEYLCLCPLFAEVPRGQIVPTYDVYIVDDDEKDDTIHKVSVIEHDRDNYNHPEFIMLTQSEVAGDTREDR